MKTVMKLHKVDNDFILLSRDQEIPPVGRGNYHKTKVGALRLMQEYQDFIAIEPNDLLNASKIKAAGFEVATTGSY